VRNFLRKENQKLENLIIIGGGGGGIGKSLAVDILLKLQPITRHLNLNDHGFYVLDGFDFALRYKEASTFFHEIAHSLLHSSFDWWQESIDEHKIALYLEEFQKLDIINKIGLPYNSIVNKQTHNQFDDKHSLLNLPLLTQPWLEQIVHYILSNFIRFIAFLKKRTIEAIRLQYIAHYIHNRISRSPSPQKKEPPIGGVKIGGEQLDFFRHAAKILYHKQLLKLSTAP
jgi:hypothetical protein